MELLSGLDVLFLDALRHKPHPTHSTVERSLESVEKLTPRRAFFTHICHDLGHACTEERLPPHVRLAYDGLEIEVDEDPGMIGGMIYRNLTEIPADFGPCAITIGNFDGVHKGHQKILRRVVGRWRGAEGWKSAVLTFDPHPAKLVAPASAPRLLTTLEQRARMILEQGINEILILPFTPEIAALEPEDFIREILVDKLKARAVLVGDEFSFRQTRRRRCGDAGGTG